MLGFIKVLRQGIDCPITLQSNGLTVTTELIEEVKNCIDEIDFSTKHMFENAEKEKQLIETY